MPDARLVARLDTRYAAETPEGIALWLRPAGVVAALRTRTSSDFAIRFVFFSICWLFLALLGRLGVGLGFLLFFLLEWLYPVVFELSPRRGDTGQAHGRAARS